MTIPEDLKYTKDHEWLRLEGQMGWIGITDFAQEQLGDIVFVDLPQVGTVLKKEDTFGVVESVKTVSDLFAPVAGKVIEINEDLVNNPEKVNQDPYGLAWMVKVEMSDLNQAQDLLNASAYQELVQEAQ